MCTIDLSFDTEPSMQILGEDLLDECQRSVVRLTDQVQVVILTAARALTQFRQDLRQCQRVRRRIDLRNDIDAQLTRFLDEISELILRVEEVRAGPGSLLIDEISLRSASLDCHRCRSACRLPLRPAGLQTGNAEYALHRTPDYRFQRDDD